MKKVEEKTNKNGRVVIQETEIRNLGSVRYKDELIADNMDPYLFSQGFKYAVRNLPQSFSSEDEKSAYMKFIENWGTVRVNVVCIFCHNGIIVLSVHAMTFITCSMLFCLLILAPGK